MSVNEKIDYLFSKINFGASNLDARAIDIMNNLKRDIQKEISEPYDRLSEGRDYLMQVGDYPFDLGDCFEAFGFEANGAFIH